MIYGITRVSTTEQVEGKSSLSDQERVIQGVCLVNGWTLDRVFRDEGVSGSIPLADRPEGGQAYRQARSGDVIVASKMDRLFRSALDALNTLEHFTKQGIKLVLADMGSSPVNENGVAKLFFTILAAMAEWERTRIHERLADGRKGKKDKGGHIGGLAPYGYSVIGHGKEASLVENSAEQEVIATARKWHKGRCTLREIADILHTNGLLSRNGGKFGPSQIARMVKE